MRPFRCRLVFAVVAVLAVLTLNLLVLMMLGCGVSGPPASLAVVQASDLGVIGSNPEIVGRDGGYSGVFAGNSVWVFGDTFLANANAEGQTLISDSWANEWGKFGARRAGSS
jgi:hypothetical protein